MLNFILLTVLIIAQCVILYYLKGNGNKAAKFILGCFELYPILVAFTAIGWTGYSVLGLMLFVGFAIGIAEAFGQKHKMEQENLENSKKNKPSTDNS